MTKRDPDQVTIPPDGRSYDEQPKWRQDFPIDWPQDEYVARRDFTKFLVLTSLAFTVGQFWILGQNLFRTRTGRPPIRPIARVDELQVGATRIFNYPRSHDNCVLVRTSENGYVAYSQKCTHLSCPVKPDASKGTLNCPCHEGIFDMTTGQPVSGPPRRPLARIDLDVKNGIIYAVGVTEKG